MVLVFNITTLLRLSRRQFLVVTLFAGGGAGKARGSLRDQKPVSLSASDTGMEVSRINNLIFHAGAIFWNSTEVIAANDRTGRDALPLCHHGLYHDVQCTSTSPPEHAECAP